MLLLLTAKEIMPRNPTSSITGIVRRLTLRGASSPQECEESENSPPDGGVEMRHTYDSPPQKRREVRRAKTFSGGGGFKKNRLSFLSSNRNSSESEREETVTPVPPPRTKRKNRAATSTFYDDGDNITRKVTEPREFPELNLRDKDGKGLMLMLRPVSLTS